MSAWGLIVDVAGYHVIPCLLGSGIVYLVVWLLFSVARVRRPADRVVFLYAALLKAALALWTGTSISCLVYYPHRLGYFAFHLPDLVPDGPPFEPDRTATGPASSEFAGHALLAVLVLALILLCWRWARIAPVYRRINESQQARVREFPEVFEVFEELVGRAYRRRSWLPRPRLMLLRTSPASAFTMGLRPPIVVVSAELAEELGSRELRGILAHELAHVRRMDYVGRWLATVLRDIMIWNPLALLWYAQLEDEQEKASDEYAAGLLRDPVAVVSGLIEVAACSRSTHVVYSGPLTAWRADKGLRRLNERVDRLGEVALSPEGQRGWSAYLLCAGIIGFLAVEPNIAVSLPCLWAVVGHGY